MAQDPKKILRRVNTDEYSSLLQTLRTARTPRPPRVECAVFGCRSGAQAGVKFYSIPAQVDRMTKWLQLINRRDLLTSASRRHAAQVCSVHFDPTVKPLLPSLYLPTTNEFVQKPAPTIEIAAGPSDQGDVLEIKLEPEETPATGDTTSGDQAGPTVGQATPNVAQLGPNVGQLSPNANQLSLNALPLVSNVAQARPNVQQRPNVAQPRPNVHFRPNITQPRPNVQLRPNYAQPRPNVAQLTSNLQLRPTVDLCPEMPISHGGPNIHNIKSNRDQMTNIEQIQPNVRPTILNVHQPHQNVARTAPILLVMPNIDQITPNLSHMMPNIDQLRSHKDKMKTINQPVKRLKTKVKLIKSKVKFTNIGTEGKRLQRNVAVQTDCVQALYRIASYSAVEQVNVPPVYKQLDADKAMRSIQVETTDELTEHITRPLRTKLENELHEANKKLERIQNPLVEKNLFLRGCDRYLDEKIANFVQSHAYFAVKFNEKYPLVFKMFALNLYLQNPTSYKFVEEFFSLPSKKKLQQLMIPVTTGFNQNLLCSFKVKVDQMSAMAKFCVVCFDVIRLTGSVYYDMTNDYLCGMQEIDQVTWTEPAEYAAVIMVRGLFGRWKQPVSFAYLSEKRLYPELKVWVDKTIAILFDIGLNVKALITKSDQEFLNISVEQNQTYFKVNEHKIYHVYDVPTLLKYARDELMRYEFHIKGSVAKWDHVVSAYDTDRQQELRVMSITDRHIRPTESADDVKLATQVFSETVAAAMHFQVVAKMQPRENKDTMQFIKKMSNLFDILYCRTLDNAYRGTSDQQKFLNDAIEYLQALEVVDAEGNIHESKFVPSLIRTIRSVTDLMADLKKSKVNYLLTKNLSKDCMHTYFEEVRRLRKCKEPTPIQFKRSFRKLFLVYLLNNTKTKATVEDMTATLAKIAEYVKTDMDTPIQSAPVQNLAVGVTDYKIRWPSNEYIAGYIIKKSLEHCQCPKMIEDLSQHCNLNGKKFDKLMEIFKCYDSKNISVKDLPKVPDKYVCFVNSMEEKYNEYCRKTDRNNINFGYNVYDTIPVEEFDYLKYMKRLYIRLKIYSDCKEMNRKIRIKRKMRESMEVQIVQ